MNEIKPCPNPECKDSPPRVLPGAGGLFNRWSVRHTDSWLCGYCGPTAATEAEAIRLHNLIPRIPEGYVVVPKEPTAEIIKAMEWQIGGNEYHPVKTWGTTAAIYKVAIEAAQEKHDETHPA